jgi:4'-phosphopantetheinyl transferase
VVRPDDAESGAPLRSLLEPAVPSRYRSMKQPRTRAAFLAARAQVREAVDEWLSDRAADVHILQRCDSCGSSGHGRPSPIGVHGVRWGSVSWSRSGSHVVVALSEDTPDVAIGIEVRDFALLGLTTQVLTSSEQDAVREAVDAEVAFLRLWTMKECAVRLGLCALDDFGGFDVELEFDRRGVVWWTGQELDLVSSGAFSTTVGSAWCRDASPRSATFPHIRHVVFRRVDPEEPRTPEVLATGVGPDGRSRTVSR